MFLLNLTQYLKNKYAVLKQLFKLAIILLKKENSAKLVLINQIISNEKLTDLVQNLSKTGSSNSISLINSLIENEQNHTNDTDKINLSSYNNLIKGVLTHPKPGKSIEFFKKIITYDSSRFDTFHTLIAVLDNKNDTEVTSVMTHLDSIAKFKTLWFRPIFSQEGEDLILEQLFGFKRNGFYIDVGSHHPFRFSNTHHLYESGWSGINIDPIPGTKQLFDLNRPRDINLELGLSESNNYLTFYIMNDPALNSFDKNYIDFIINTTNYKLIETIQTEVTTLNFVIEKYAKDKPIDFISIDVEGYELAVLRGNDWKTNRPKVILIEILDFNIQTLEQNPVHNFIINQNYQIVAMTTRTIFYKNMI